VTDGRPRPSAASATGADDGARAEGGHPPEGTPRAPTGPLDGEEIREASATRCARRGVGADHGHGAGRRRLLFNTNVLVIPFAQRRAGSGRGGFGLLMATLGAGAVVGAVALAALGPRAAIRHRAGRARAGALRVHRAPGGGAQRAGGGARAVS